MHNYRELVSFNLQEEQIQIRGPDIIVEIDESRFGTRCILSHNPLTGNVTEFQKDIWVFGGVERTPERRMFAIIVENRIPETLLTQIEKHVHPQFTIYSDMWKEYDNIYL